KIAWIQQILVSNFLSAGPPYSRLDRHGDTLRSTKDGHFGIGLDNVRKALEHYDGRLNIKTTDGFFTVTVIIPISE
ncbi:GHKL domain-containing protein, partial [Ruminococcus sp.]|uniref:GHKL domain-containing protein n=1 Tax=Ruminococcus sp. TaxID=41978 RepID=UPI002C6A534A